MGTPSQPLSKPLPARKALALIERARKLSRYAQRCLQGDPDSQRDLIESLHRPFDRAAMESVLAAAGCASEEALHRALRRLRKQVLLRVIARDLGGLADLIEVTETMSELADLAIARACACHGAWLKERHGAPLSAASGAEQELLVVAMGKLGGRELNVSSDVDLVFVYPEDGETAGPLPISNHEFFTRLARRVIAALSDLTPDGYVFRVDTRLRPLGESGPLVVSFLDLENYFVSQGREWERLAWIKARVLGGSSADELSRLVQPFVYRKYLDYGAFASMRELHSQIRREVERRELHDNVKIGPGGIREIEFIAQVYQLIRGGRVARLRVRPTLQVLRLLGELRLLPARAVTELTEAYRFLRNLEHRLQYLDDIQTQALPRNPRDRALVAEAMGCSDYGELLQKIERHRAHVTRHFEAVFASPQAPAEQEALAFIWQDQEPKSVRDKLAALGYQRPDEIRERLKRLRQGQRLQQLPEASQKSIAALVPALLKAASRFSNPDRTLESLLDLLESVSRRAAYLALLQEYPLALERLAQLASASRWACEYLTRHPILLDELLDTRELYSPPDWERLRAELDQHLADAQGDTERQMDALRHFQHAVVFRLLAKDLEGLLPLEILSDHLTELADLILERVLALCWRGLKLQRPEFPDPARFAIIGYGKLGGKELGYASDLDLVFLYDDEHPEAQEVYARLAQRINTWLTSYTAAGVLYETDLRLRPDGAAGMLVSSVTAFAEYQRSHAWTWEHQALTRARFVAGDPGVGRRFEALRKEVLCQERDPARLRDEVLAMRKKMLEAHPNPSALFDLKHDRGGIIDVEFIVQHLVLSQASAYPELTGNIGNLALLKLAADLGLIAADLAEGARLAYREFRRLQHRIRLDGEKYARVPLPQVAQGVEAVLALWRSVFGET